MLISLWRGWFKSSWFFFESHYEYFEINLRNLSYLCSNCSLKFFILCFYKFNRDLRNQREMLRCVLSLLEVCFLGWWCRTLGHIWMLWWSYWTLDGVICLTFIEQSKSPFRNQVKRSKVLKCDLLRFKQLFKRTYWENSWANLETSTCKFKSLCWYLCVWRRTNFYCLREIKIFKWGFKHWFEMKRWFRPWGRCWAWCIGTNYLTDRTHFSCSFKRKCKEHNKSWTWTIDDDYCNVYDLSFINHQSK